jgi:hypothetical protein
MSKDHLIEAAQHAIERGWCFFPVKLVDKNKKPLVKWGSISSTSIEQAEEWLRTLPVDAWGIPTGSRNGIVVVDIDGDYIPELPPTYTVKTPRGGWHFYFHTRDRIANSVGRVGPGVDIRGEGGFVCLHGGARGDGERYEAVDLQAPIADLPDSVASLCRRAPERQLVVLDHAPSDAAVYRRAEAYVDRCEPAISGSNGHAQTLSVARALVSGFGLGEADALNLMRRFSARCLPPWSERELEHKVSSAMQTQDPSGRPRGWMVREESIVVDLELEEPAEEGASPTVEQPVAREGESSADAVREDLAAQLAACGDIAAAYMRWLRASSRIWQPGLAVGSALALGATLAGRRYVWRGVTSHLYVLGIGASGVGKDIAAKRLSYCLGEAVMGGVPSTKVLRDTLEELSDTGRGVCLISGEVAKLLRQLLGGRTPAYLQLAGQTLLELATWGPEPIRWDRPAIDQAKGRQQVITAPCLSVYGTATPDDLLDILGDGAVKDGMLGRFLMFRAQDNLPDKDCALVPPGPPRDLIMLLEDVERARGWWRESKASGGELSPEPDEMPGTRGSVLAAYDADMHAKRQSGKTNGLPDELVARLAEHAARVSIALAGLSSSPHVSEDHERLAIAIVEQCARDLADATRRHAADGEWERGMKRVLAAIERLRGPGGRVPISRVLQAVRHRDTKAWIGALSEEGAIRVREAGNARGRQVTYLELAG